MSERKPHQNSYRKIKVEKELIKDTSLTPIEIAIIFKMLTKNPDFRPTYTNMAAILHTSIKSIRTAAQHLKEKGYLRIKLTPQGYSNKWEFSQTKEFLKDKEK